MSVSASDKPLATPPMAAVFCFFTLYSACVLFVGYIWIRQDSQLRQGFKIDDKWQKAYHSEAVVPVQWISMVHLWAADLYVHATQNHARTFLTGLWYSILSEWPFYHNPVSKVLAWSHSVSCQMQWAYKWAGCAIQDQRTQISFRVMKIHQVRLLRRLSLITT